MFKDRADHLAALPLGDQLEDYIQNGFKYSFGSFLNAVIENDLSTAAAYADHKNLPLLGVYGMYMFEYAPLACRNSKENRESWQGLNNISEDK